MIVNRLQNRLDLVFDIFNRGKYCLHAILRIEFRVAVIRRESVTSHAPGRNVNAQTSTVYERCSEIPT